MDAAENRDSLRVPCGYPVRVYGERGELICSLADLSRTGLALFLSIERLLEIEPDTPLGNVIEVARALDDIVGPEFEADLHFEMLGPLVRKRAAILRVGFSDADEQVLQLGCRFEEPLTNEETDMLGVGLPPQGVTSEGELRDVPAPRHRADDEPPGAD